MSGGKIRILGISGSLRADSSNSTLVRLAASLPDPEVEFEIERTEPRPS